MIQFTDPKGQKYSPCFFPTSPKDIHKKFSGFLKQAEKQLYLRETEDEEVGERYIRENIDSANLDHLKEFATDKMLALLEIGIDEGLTEEELLELALESKTKAEATGGGISHNSLLVVPVKGFVIDLHEIAGKIDTKKHKSLFKAFIDLLSPEEIDKVLNNSYAEDDGKMYLEANFDTWETAVDEDEFKNAMIKKLGLLEQDVVEENPIVAAADVIDFKKFKKNKQNHSERADAWIEDTEKAWKKESSKITGLKGWDVKFTFYPPDNVDPEGMVVIESVEKNLPNTIQNDLNHIAHTFFKKYLTEDFENEKVEHYYPGHKQYPNYPKFSWYIMFDAKEDIKFG